MSDSQKRINEFIRTALRSGWRVEGGGAWHYKLIPPDRGKPMVVLPASASDGNGWKNARAALRRSGLNV